MFYFPSYLNVRGGIGVDRWAGERVAMGAWEGSAWGGMGGGRRDMCGRRCDVWEVGAGRGAIDAGESGVELGTVSGERCSWRLLAFSGADWSRI